VSPALPPIDPSRFHKANVIDTCAVWNLLASALLTRSAQSHGCVFSITDFVHYECLIKPRRSEDARSGELRSRLAERLASRAITAYRVEISDLQDPEIQNHRARVGKGELSALAFARRTRQAFMTDDQRARRVAHGLQPSPCPQTTPHLLGWLVFEGYLGDSEARQVIAEHESLGRPLRPHFQTIYERACEFRLRGRKP
jgi:hypothetical protein